MSAALVIDDLRGGIPGREIVRGLSLRVPAGEVHAIMGPNGSGKSTLSNLLFGRPGYTATGGSVRLETADGTTELLGLPTWQRARAGLFLGMQSPIEVPGVHLPQALGAALRGLGRNDEADARVLVPAIAAEAERIGLADRLLDRALNVELSGGEKKRNETVQLAILRPPFAVLDEIDSGLDVDALRAVAQRVREEVETRGMGVLVITHFARLLDELPPTRIHVLRGGRIVDEGGPELAAVLETEGYAKYATEEEPAMAVVAKNTGFADPNDPFADPFR